MSYISEIFEQNIEKVLKKIFNSFEENLRRFWESFKEVLRCHQDVSTFQQSSSQNRKIWTWGRSGHTLTTVNGLIYHRGYFIIRSELFKGWELKFFNFGKIKATLLDNSGNLTFFFTTYTNNAPDLCPNVVFLFTVLTKFQHSTTFEYSNFLVQSQLLNISSFAFSNHFLPNLRLVRCSGNNSKTQLMFTNAQFLQEIHFQVASAMRERSPVSWIQHLAPNRF